MSNSSVALRSPSSARWPWLVALAGSLGPLASAQGCRCSPSEQALPPSRPASSRPASADAAAAPSSCPQRASWAGSLDDDVELEVLHESKAGSSTHGAGYRLRSDGRLETYDDIDVAPNDAGKLAFKKVQGHWRVRGPVDASGLRAARSAAARALGGGLGGVMGEAGPGRAWTLVVVRGDGGSLVACYHGEEAPPALTDLEQAAHALVSHATATGPRDGGKD